MVRGKKISDPKIFSTFSGRRAPRQFDRDDVTIIGIIV